MTDNYPSSEQSAQNPDSEITTAAETGIDRRIWAPIVALMTVGFAVGPIIGNDFHIQILFLMLTWGGLATSWNILGGYTGYVSFGHAAFFALGGFTVGLSQQYLSLGQSVGPGLIGVIALAGLIPMVIAALVAYPFLRLSGGYFAIAMLGFQLALREVFTAVEALGGGFGVSVSLEVPSFVAANVVIYYLMALVVLATVLAAYFIKNSTFGYSLFAIRENEDAAESLGIPTTRYKIITFVISALFAGLIGGIYVYNLAFFNSGSIFSLLNTLNLIVYAVLGGLGTVLGGLIGAIGMIFLKNVVLSGVSDAHVFFTGFFVVVVMLGFPRGVIGLVTDLSTGRLQLERFDIRNWLS